MAVIDDFRYLSYYRSSSVLIEPRCTRTESSTDSANQVLFEIKCPTKTTSGFLPPS